MFWVCGEGGSSGVDGWAWVMVVCRVGLEAGGKGRVDFCDFLGWVRNR